ncbi:hypothetical protein [Candidatus Contendibacter odensensis]|uniref:Uncharacterized protein n=1 Tax=Candidatus Contendobacter odensis Run_B_J11 TaxID=1400861 RepID=A0A7U7GF36_9GAMM|nr:hypothetical protein [Candidatus Contendobacter odensis]CDH46964.1 hypothetical protein BN874_690014 [Candidatus Contendobacter odensis Run_B_J11]
MALVYKDRVQETTTTTGTGTLTLAGAVSGFQSFSAIGNANTCIYCIEDANGAWEVGVGTYTLSGTTLARTTVLASSASGSAITLSSGTHKVYVTADARIMTAADRMRVGGFSARGDGSTLITITNGGTTLVSSAAKTEDFDIDSAFDPSTGIWQPTQSGVYIVGGSAITNSTATSGSTFAVYCDWSTDGSSWSSTENRGLLWRGISGAVGSVGGSGAFLVYANGSTDRWRLSVFYNGAGTITVPGIAGNKDWIRFWAKYMGETS